MRHFGRRAVWTGLVVALGALLAVTCAAAGPATSMTTPTTFVGENPCTGEALTGTGTLHTVTTENLSQSGNIEFHLATTLSGLTATTVLGKKYVVREAYNQEFTISKAAQETFAVVAHYVRVGEDGTYVLGDDFYQYLRTHITANANGLVTAFRIDQSDPLDSCQ